MKQLYEILKNTGLPVAYHSFKASGINKIPEPPFIVYLFTGSENMGADNRVYQKINSYDVELYTNKKDITSETLLENALDDATIFYDKTEDYIEDEALFRNTYRITI